MKLRRYCVTVMDNWTPTRVFWTLDGAKRFYLKHRNCGNVFKWEAGEWGWMCGARDQATDRTMTAQTDAKPAPVTVKLKPPRKISGI